MTARAVSAAADIQKVTGTYLHSKCFSIRQKKNLDLIIQWAVPESLAEKIFSSILLLISLMTIL
ncbi:hypothetical protein CK203_022291 [Vitis vinifera]|uniref:Uncharacterized protein n=1 Tax=Vitis vinifera TaxID=29760 RepID=A0A438I954_VITVI|nr:hypothetical protein CK203_022291 [Vitis vinifera]